MITLVLSIGWISCAVMPSPVAVIRPGEFGNVRHRDLGFLIDRV